MLKRTVVVALTVGLAVGFLCSCGDSSSSKSAAPAANGSLLTLIGDAPLCDVLSFHVTITGLTLTPVGGGREVGVIVSTATSAPSIKVNFGVLRDSSTILNLGSVSEGTYSQATILLSSAQLAVYDPTQNPPVKTITADLSKVEPTVNIEPPLTIAKGKVSVLRIDFDMLRSIELDANGQVTGKVVPVLRFTPLTASGSEGFGEADDLVGFVRSVSNTSATTAFTGSFLMQFLSASTSGAPALNVNFTDSTEMFGSPALNQLLTDSFVEVDGFFDSDGSLVAKTVEVEYQEDPAKNKVGLIGPITSLTKDPNGNLTQFSLWVREQEPDTSSYIAPDSIVVVNVSPSTTYQFSSRSTNFANLVFGPTALAVGQEVVLHGPYTMTAGLPTTAAADSRGDLKVYLKLQSLQGSFAPPFLVPPGSDDKTGAFQLAPCCTLFQGTPVYVLTNNQTTFVNMGGLSGLTPQRGLLVKGLPFFQPQAGTINGVPVPAGTLVVLAKQVHRL
jgi:hypothetical protein